MSAMPQGFHAAHDEASIRYVVERLEKYELHLVEARHLIAPALSMELDERAERRLTDYLDAVLDRVHSQEISADTAASDIWQLAQAAQAGDPDLEHLEEIGAD